MVIITKKACSYSIFLLIAEKNEKNIIKLRKGTKISTQIKTRRGKYEEINRESD